MVTRRWQAPGNFLTAWTSIVLVTWIRGIGQVSDNERMTLLSPQKSIFWPCPRFNPLHSGHISYMLAAATLNSLDSGRHTGTVGG